ncbi:MAG: DUF2840 domain-containing protein [Hyphomonadaceae bacterium]
MCSRLDNAPPPRDAALTDVHLIWIRDRKEYWIRFGAAAEKRILDQSRRVFSFAPGAVFALVRWEANDFGTEFSRIDIARAATPSAARTFIPFVTQGAILLLSQHGWTKVRGVLAVIDAVEKAGIAPQDAAPDYWRHVHNRIFAGEAPRAYTRERHRAWLMRREIAL